MDLVSQRQWGETQTDGTDWCIIIIIIIIISIIIVIIIMPVVHNLCEPQATQKS